MPRLTCHQPRSAPGAPGPVRVNRVDRPPPQPRSGSIPEPPRGCLRVHRHPRRSPGAFLPVDAPAVRHGRPARWAYPHDVPRPQRGRQTLPWTGASLGVGPARTAAHRLAPRHGPCYWRRLKPRSPSAPMTPVMTSAATATSAWRVHPPTQIRSLSSTSQEKSAALTHTVRPVPVPQTRTRPSIGAAARSCTAASPRRAAFASHPGSVRSLKRTSIRPSASSTTNRSASDQSRSAGSSQPWERPGCDEEASTNLRRIRLVPPSSTSRAVRRRSSRSRVKIQESVAVHTPARVRSRPITSPRHASVEQREHLCSKRAEGYRETRSRPGHRELLPGEQHRVQGSGGRSLGRPAPMRIDVATGIILSSGAGTQSRAILGAAAASRAPRPPPTTTLGRRQSRLHPAGGGRFIDTGSSGSGSIARQLTVRSSTERHPRRAERPTQQIGAPDDRPSRPVDTAHGTGSCSPRSSCSRRRSHQDVVSRRRTSRPPTAGTRSDPHP